MRVLLLVLFTVGACSAAPQDSGTSLEPLASSDTQTTKDRQSGNTCQKQDPPPVRPVGFARVDMSEEEFDALFDRYKSANSICLDECTPNGERDPARRFCEATCGGEGLGGGCAHLVGYSLHDEVPDRCFGALRSMTSSRVVA